MADTRLFTPIAQFPTIDYGAIYENAKMRREEAEQRKLEYLNSFQKERGAFAPNLQESMQVEWDAIQNDLASGDMSFEAKARRQQMYNDYKDKASKALEYSNMLNEYEADVLANPQQYNSPDLLITKLQEDRLRPVFMEDLDSELSTYPSLSSFRRFTMPELSPNVSAGTIFENLKQSGGINNFYDQQTGKLKDDVLTSTVSTWFDVNALSEEEENQAIAHVLRQRGLLTNNPADITKVRNLDDETRVKYLGEYASLVGGQLSNMISTDIDTEREKMDRELSMFRRKQSIQSSTKAAQTKPASFGLQRGAVSYVPPIEIDKSGFAVKRGEPSAVNADFVLHSNVQGTQPSYYGNDGVQRYIEKVGLTPEGIPYTLVRYKQEVLENGRKSSHVARELVPWNDIASGEAGSGLSNTKQAALIQSTFENMVSSYTPAAPASSLANAMNQVTGQAITTAPAAQAPQPTQETLQLVEQFKKPGMTTSEIVDIQARVNTLPSDQQAIFWAESMKKSGTATLTTQIMEGSPYGSAPMPVFKFNN